MAGMLALTPSLFFFFFLKRDWVWIDPLEDSNSVTLPVSGGGGNQGWNGGDVV